MAQINLKKRKQRIFNGEEKYFTGLVRYSTIPSEDLIDYACEDSGMPKGQFVSAFYAIFRQIERYVLNGHSIQLGNLGYLYLGAKTHTAETEEEAGASCVDRLSVRFRQGVKLKNVINSKVRLSVVGEKTNQNGEDGNTGEDNTGSGTDSGQQYTITVAASPSNGGTVTGGGQYAAGAQATLQATAASGFEFSKWSDGNTNAQRTITVNSNQTLTAIFTNTGGGDDGEISGGI